MGGKIKESLFELISYCERSGYKGWDPYDGLNSKIFQLTPLIFWSTSRLAWIQFFKRSPVNFRKIAAVPKGYNPKGLGLFLTTYCNLYKINPQEELIDKIVYLADKILHTQSNGYSGSCWGYNFDWQSKAFYLESKTPTIVATSFIVDSLLNAYEITKNKDYLDTSISSTDFVLKDLNRINKPSGFMFSYSPKDNRAVYNASLLGARLLARVYNFKKEEAFKEAAYLNVLSVTKLQNENGSFPHSDQVGNRWRDSFHTGFKLECISEYQKYCNDGSFNMNIDRGFKYWIENFFLSDGTPKYYDTSNIYPIDIHCPSQFFAAMYKLQKFDHYEKLSEKIYNWTISHFQDKKKGYFYYQITKKYTNKIPYMRWSQAWATYGLSYYLLYLNSKYNGKI